MNPAPRPAEDRNPNGEDVARILTESGLPFSTLESGHRWRVAMGGHEQAPVQIDVVYSDTFTVVLGKLFTLPDGDDTEIYRAIAERNYDLEQMKLSVDKSGDVFASFEVPTRILDRRELMENIVSLAAALDSMGQTGNTMPSPFHGLFHPRPPDVPVPRKPDDRTPAIQDISAPSRANDSRELNL